MKESRSLGQGLASLYRGLASIVFNSLLLFVLLNVAAQAYLDTKASKTKKQSSDGTGMAHREYHPSLAPVYPGMSESQVEDLIKETRQLTQGYDTYTQFKERPANGRYVKVHPEGFRYGTNQAKWPPDDAAFNIFVFGGSTTFGYRVGDDDTIPSQLQELIRKEAGLPAAVYNFGRGAYMSTQERVLFEKLLLQGHVPRMAIFIDGLNDLAIPGGEPIHTKDLRKCMDRGRASHWDTFIEVLPVTRFLAAITSKDDTEERKRHGTGELESEVGGGKRAQEALERYRKNMKMITATAEAFKVIPVFVWQPVPVHEYDQAYNIFAKFDYDGMMPSLRAGYGLMAAENQSGSLGDQFIFCADIQRGVRRPLYVDAVHYGSEMCAMTAREIFDNLKRRGILTVKR